MTYPGHTTEEVARRGREIYEERIRTEPGAEDEGKFVVIDLQSGRHMDRLQRTCDGGAPEFRWLQGSDPPAGVQ